MLRVGYVANYGDAHITVAFFPEGAPSWLQRKLPEVVCCASAISAYAMQPVSIPMPKPAQPPNSISDYWAIASPCMYNDVARLREALANPSVNPTMGSARGLWAGSKHKRQSWDAIAVLVADPRVDARDRYSGLPVVDRLFAHAPPSIAEAMLASGRYDAEWLLEKSVEFDRGTWVRAIVGSGRVPPERVEAMYKLARKSGKTYAESGFSAHFANARELIDRRAHESMREWARKEQEETPMETPSADDKDWEML